MEDDLNVFKFKKIDKHLIESLVNPALYFAAPKSLNDPFDCRIDLRNSFHQAVLHSTGLRRKFLTKILENREFFENWETKMEDIGICSFTQKINETLLWSHYADDHKGISILYRLPRKFIESAAMHLSAGGIINYRQDPMIEWLQTADIEKMEMDTFVGQIIHIFFKSKGPAWSYESEVRLIRGSHGLVAIEGDYIRQIIFGLQTSPEDIKLISKLAKDHCGCNQFGRMSRNSHDFGFSLNSLDNSE